MSENRKSAIVTVAQSLSMIITFVLVFLGSLYAYDSWIVSIIISTLSLLLIFVLINHFIEQKEKLNRTGYKTKTYLFLVVYALLIIPTSFFGIHAFNVEFFEKEKVLKNVEKKVQYIKSMEGMYDNEYKKFIEDNKSKITSLNAQARGLALSGIPDINVKIDSIKDQLQSSPLLLSPGAVNSLLNCNVSQVVGIVNAGYVSPLDTAFAVAKRRIQGNYLTLDELSAKAHKWNRFTISKTVKALDERMNEERDSLSFQLEKMTFKSSNLKGLPILITDLNLMNQPIQLLFTRQEPMIYILTVIFQCLLLLPYWLTRKPRYSAITKISESKLDTFSRSL